MTSNLEQFSYNKYMKFDPIMQQCDNWSKYRVNDHSDEKSILTKKENITIISNSNVTDFDFIEGCTHMKKNFYCQGGFTVARVMVLSKYVMMMMEENLMYNNCEEPTNVDLTGLGFDGFEFDRENNIVYPYTCS